ncbi:MAG: GTPase HflX [Planctomycetota bacterium]|nr:MAG: GTPase HflX [Planctomycetota bacterium]
MSELHETAFKPERAILIGMIFPYSIKEETPLDEIGQLAKTAGAEVLIGITQKMILPKKATFFGKGKIQEIKEKVEELKPDVIICDNELSPSQSRNLEKILECRIIDRSELIIDIFVNHASTKQSQLQVQLAQMKYTMPRLKRMWTHLSRIQGGIGMKGPGETQLETDKQIINKKIHEIQQKLNQISERKEREIETRDDNFNISLIGYTNSGKSTILKAFTGLDTYIADKLFATLDTTTRKVQLEQDLEVYLTDTVGFVRDLPHHLVASFKATLLEAMHAKLLLHIVDASDPKPQNQIMAVNLVLKEMKFSKIPTILVFNKIDLVEDIQTIEKLKERYPEAIFISATDLNNFEFFKNEIIKQATANRKVENIKVHAGAGKIIVLIDTKTKILDKSYDGEYINYKLECEKSIFEQICSRNIEYEKKL